MSDGTNRGTTQVSNLASRAQLAAGVIPNIPQNLDRWLRNPQAIKPGCLMPNFTLNDEQTTQLVAYLEGLR
jgi:cytochrome c oxidase subunit 2